MMLLGAYLGLLIAPAAAGEACTASEPCLGVLEEVETATGGRRSHVRVLFRSRGGVWEAFPQLPRLPDEVRRPSTSFPPTAVWGICEGSRLVAKVTSSTPAQYGFASDIGYQVLKKGTKVRPVGPRGRRFSGYLGRAVHRPLVAVTVGRCSVPAGWKIAKSVPLEVQSVAEAALPRRVDGDTHGRTRMPLAYETGSGSWVVEIARSDRVDDRRVVVVEPGKPAVLTDTGESRKSGGRERPISPQLIVDVGDWDEDGKVEVLTKFEGNNLDGYILLSHDGRVLAKFLWNYH